MVVATLIHSDYIFVTPGYLPDPPAPNAKAGQPVGIHCPICHAGLKYWTPKADAWFIGCPNSQKHNTRTWRCDQFNHERMLINLGVPRPIISTYKDWGPRVSPAGHILDPVPPSPSPTQNFMPFSGHLLGPPHLDHPFQGRALQGHALSNPFPNSPTPNSSASASLHVITRHSTVSQSGSNLSGPAVPVITHDPTTSLSGPHVSGPAIPCKRLGEGPVPKGHRKSANKKCRFEYCQACCNTYGLGVCRAHPRTNSKIEAFSQPYARPTHSLTANTTPNSTSSGLFNARPPRVTQWAQSANSLGRRLHVDSVVTLHKNRLEQYQPEIQKKYDESKMVTLYLWLNESKPTVITAYFKDWPQARLEECDLLIQAVLGEVGELWNRAISMWDEAIDAWREIPVDYPHRYASAHRTIVVRLGKVNPLTPGLPQSSTLTPRAHPLQCEGDLSLVQSGPSKAPVFPPSTPEQAHPSSPRSQAIRICGPHIDALPSAPSPFTPESPAVPIPRSVVDLSELPDSPSVSETPSPSPLGVKCEPQDDQDLPNANVSNPVEKSSSVNNSPLDSVVPQPTVITVPSNVLSDHSQLKPRWPSKTVLISSLLAWHREGQTGDMVLSWKKHYGHEWKEVLPTMYRYRGWINRVGYVRFAAEYKDQPNAVVGQARIRFKQEFNHVACVNGEL
ncbi:uncharacterized protein MELLADRAFT_70002 [Melampsora larici-populina 98AG31]|uniref:Uncharacterized protein n=1 Tax=Melampsora larici-populina (strain 98AG31 / pathotype 3-4-7) TaxID=747676 RepID=F4SD49_MELLP|nr:uncharacterized protein MELLADRAFT_70002 [Melampsora larici-populina 98AG31]EGF97422.1 hypothetical protein MELLADRAFT_70002 [Melampsora larici-populina 98AG31]